MNMWRISIKLTDSLANTNHTICLSNNYQSPMNSKATALKSVFKGSINQSYLQISFNKLKKEDNKLKKEEKEQDREKLIQEEEIENDVNANSARLKRNYVPYTPFVTLKKQGLLYTEPDKSSGWGCFGCYKRKAKKVVLQNRVVSVRDKSGRVAEALNFDTVTIELNNKGDTVKAVVKADNQSSEKEFYFEVTADENVREWQEAFQRCIQGSLGSEHKLRYLSTVPKYWNTLSITEKEFNRKCNSGDILLFKSTHALAKVQRDLTNSDYDHIALVLRNQNNQILMFESNSDTGVALTFWKDMVKFKWYLSTERVVYRQLKINRDQKFLTTMEEFVVNNLDKKFGIGLGKLLILQSKIMTKQEEKERTYFCSELVAKCYKQLGLLDQKKSSTQYFPVHFTENRDLDLLQEEFGPQELICFDPQICTDYS